MDRVEYMDFYKIQSELTKKLLHVESIKHLLNVYSDTFVVGL